MEPNRAGHGDNPSSGQPQPYVPSPFFGPGGEPPPGYGPPSAYGPPPGAGTPPGYGAAAAQGRPIGPGRGRPFLITLFALLIELIVIAGYSNQWVTKKLVDHFSGFSTRDLVVRSSLTFNWRFGPQGGSDPGHVWLAQLMFVVGFIVLSLLFIALVVRGPVTFFRTFVSTWAVVVLATVLAAFIRSAIASPFAIGRDTSRVQSILFQSITSIEILAALALGLVLALIVAILAIATRRPVLAPAPVVAETVMPTVPEPDQPEPFHGDDARRAPQLSYGTPPPPASGPYLFEKNAGDAETARHPVASDDSSTTRQFPIVDPPAAEDRREPSDATQAAAAPERSVPAGASIHDDPAFDEPDTTERTTRLPAFGHTAEASGAASEPAPAPSSESAAAPSSPEQINEGAQPVQPAPEGDATAVFRRPTFPEPRGDDEPDADEPDADDTRPRNRS